MAAQRGDAAECKHSAARRGPRVPPRAPPGPAGTLGAPRRPLSGMPVLHFAPARPPRYASTLLFPLPSAMRTWSRLFVGVGPSTPCHPAAAWQLPHSGGPSAGNKTLAPSRTVPLSSQSPVLEPFKRKRRHLSGAGPRVGGIASFPKRTVALRGPCPTGTAVPPRAGPGPARRAPPRRCSRQRALRSPRQPPAREIAARLRAVRRGGGPARVSLLFP